MRLLGPGCTADAPILYCDESQCGPKKQESRWFGDWLGILTGAGLLHDVRIVDEGPGEERVLWAAERSIERQFRQSARGKPELEANS